MQLKKSKIYKQNVPSYPNNNIPYPLTFGVTFFQGQNVNLTPNVHYPFLNIPDVSFALIARFKSVY
jgi:hypothetical protein